MSSQTKKKIIRVYHIGKLLVTFTTYTGFNASNMAEGIELEVGEI